VGSGIPGLSCGEYDPPDLTDTCVSDASCESEEYCKKNGCNTFFGSCEPVPSCDSEVTYPACGCDGKIYEDNCAAREKGVTTTNIGSCLHLCLSCEGAHYPPGYCPGQDGQTKASVVEGDTRTPEPKVTGELYNWPPSKTPTNQNLTGDDRHYSWKDTKKRSPTYSARTFQPSASMDPYNLYYDDYTGACYPGVGSAISYDLLADNRKWFRIELRKSGFEPYFTYRRHEYGERHDVKDFGGNCSSIDCDSEATRSLPHEDWGRFKMWEHDENRQKLPDLFPDPRAFAEGNDGRELECVDFDESTQEPDDIVADKVDLISLRIRVSIANIGSGPFHVERPPLGKEAGECPCPKGFDCNASEKCVASSCDPNKSSSDNVCPRDMTCRDVQGDGQDERCALYTCDMDADDPNLDCEEHKTDGGDPKTSGKCTGLGRFKGGDCDQSGDLCKEDTSDCNCESNEVSDICEPTTTQVIQRVARTDPWADYPPKRVDLNADLEHHEGHGHLHLGKVVKARLVDKSGGEVGGKSNKISFNLYDVTEFDDEIRKEVQNTPSKQWGDSGHYDQGLTPGWKDVYKPEYAGQGIIVGTKKKVKNEHAGSERYIEVTVNPNDEFVERTDKNNTVRAKYIFPEWVDGASYCDVYRGCDDYGDTDDNRFNAICENYGQWYCGQLDEDENSEWCTKNQWKWN